MESSISQQENMVFNDAHGGDSVYFSPLVDKTYHEGADADAAMGEYLSRPVRIATYIWSTNDARFKKDDIRPWRLFGNYAPIQRKLHNYAYISGNLVIKALVNGTSFLYGDILASYQPYVDYTATRAYDPTGAGAVSKFYLTALSQRPSAHISVNDSSGFQMTLPYTNKKNAIRIRNTVDWDAMGRLDLNSFSRLLTASSSGAEQTVSIVLYAWMENVKLYGPTEAAPLSVTTPVQCFPRFRSRRNYKHMVNHLRKVVDYGVRDACGDTYTTDLSSNNFGEPFSEDEIPQASRTYSNKSNKLGTEDEYGQSPVSSTASAIAAAAGWVGDNVPLIAPYMRATQSVASFTATVAKAFGYTDPPVLDNVKPFKDMPFHSLASPEISDPTAKLTLDSKNELTIDSRTVGLDGTDELAIKSLVTRRTFLASRTWVIGDNSGLRLASFGVTPDLRNTDTSPSTGLAIQRTPMGHVSRMFKYWRGDIEFTMRFIATPFHKGRLRITWEPDGNNEGDETILYSRIIDLSEDREVTFTVPWLNDNLWLRVPQTNSATTFYSLNNTFPPINRDNNNGMLSVFIETELTAPDNSDDVVMLFYVNGGTNMAFADPQAPDQKYSARDGATTGQALLASGNEPLGGDLIPQSTLDSVGGGAVQAHASKNITFTEVRDEVDKITTVTMGEAVHSLRPLMRRSTHLFRNILDGQSNASGAMYYLQYNLPRQPALPGFDTVGMWPVSGTRYNYVNWLPSSWMRICFLGERGSYRYKANISNHAGPLYDMSFLRSRDQMNSGNIFFGYTGNNSLYNAALTLISNESSTGWEGMALTNQSTQAGLAAEAPMYSKYRFINTFKGAQGSETDDTRDDAIVLRAGIPTTSNTAATTYIDVYASVGTDYTPFFFINVPPLFFQTGLPTQEPF